MINIQNAKYKYKKLLCMANDFKLLALFGMRIGPTQLIRLFREFPWLVKGLGIHTALDYTKGSFPYSSATVSFIFQYLVYVLETYVNNPDQIVWVEELLTPEIPLAMGFVPFMPESIGLVLPLVKNDICESYIDVSENEGYPSDMCSFIKTSLGLVLKDGLPKPRLILTTNSPCESASSGYIPIEEKYKVPVFRMDQPYEFNDASIGYYTQALWKMIRFMEAETGVKMDFDRLRKICENRNQASESIIEFLELNRAKPSPAGTITHTLSILGHSLMPGSKAATDLAVAYQEESKRRYDKQLGPVKKEKIRYVMWGVPFGIDVGYYQWLEEEYCAVMVAEMYSSRNYSIVDTSTPDTMLSGLAADMMQGPMARHTKGPATNYYEDLIRKVKDYDADMVILGDHVGCKKSISLKGIVRDVLKKNNTPCLTIQFDVCDTRITAPEQIRHQTTQFMEVIMKV